MTGLSQADPRVRKHFTAIFQLAQLINPRAYVSSVKRDSKKQSDLYDAWLAGRSKYPAAPPGTSKHELGLAVDIGGMTDSQLAYLGQVWRSWGGRWGGTFRNRDPIHFEA